MIKFQLPNSKIQESPKTQTPNRPVRAGWRFGTWDFFGIWNLGFGNSTLLCAFVLTLSVSSSSAQTNTDTAPPGNRYLLVLETSRSMQRRTAGTLQAVQDLLTSGMGGQLRRGDTLGIWTYNEQLYAGRFALQQWSPEAHRTVVSRAMAFLQDQNYQHDGVLPLVMPALDRLIKQSPFITIILISDGEQKIHGTPFDAGINQSFDLWAKDQQKARMPLLTILRAQGGRLAAYSVNAAPWPVDLPPLPQELLAAKVPKKEPAASAPAAKPPPPVGPSLYLSGKKTQPVVSSNSVAPLATNVLAGNETNQAVLAAVTPSQTQAVLQSQSSPPSNAAQATYPAKPGPDSSAPPATVVAQEPAKTATSLAASAPAPPPLDAARLSSSATSNQAVVSAAPSASPAASAPKTERAQILPAKASPDSNQSSILSPPASSLAAPAIGSQLPASSPEPPISSVQYPVSGFRIWMIAGPVFAAATILAIVWMRRSRASRHASLITRSYEREKP